MPSTAKSVPEFSISSLHDCLAHHSAGDPDALAIGAAGVAPLTYAGLFDAINRIVTALRGKGFHKESRIAVVLPPGPEMAVAITAIASGMVCLPLNPALAAADWERIFADFAVDALLTIEGTARRAEYAATKLDLPCLPLLPGDADAPLAVQVGKGAEVCHPAADNAAMPTLCDDAFILPTSGTTAAPKAVPLSHLNICHSASATARSLALTRQDRLLSVLPLHHAHGLISGLMASLRAGAGIIYMRGFDAPGFFDHLTTFRPTWFTAVPAIHQAVIAEASRQEAALNGHSLRLIRSASASLSVARFETLEELFGVPVIETFGMTEAASQVTSNPLPPAMRKPGSVGQAAGPEVIILNEAGTAAAAEEVGELALRGPNMTRGYISPGALPLARDGDGWIRTGDLGYLDEDGYLYITGRLKELINRGGEKISPLKIDDVLLSHPDIAEAVAFAVPHPRLGEDVGAAVVLRDEAALSVSDIQRFALEDERLRDAELPRHLVIVDSIPKTVTGKVRRTSMADLLGVKLCEGAEARAPYSAPRSETETMVAAIWRDVFSGPEIGRDDNFFALGGDSLLAVQIALRVEMRCGVTLSLRSLFEASTVAELAAHIDAGQSAADEGFALTREGAEGLIQGPVSFAQEAILDLEAAIPGYPVFTMPFAYRLTGKLDVTVLETCLRRLIARHAVLRTTFRRIGDEWRTSPASTVNLKLAAEDWRVIPEGYRWTFIDGSVDDEMWDVFDVTKRAGFRCRIMQFGDAHHVLILTLHHIIMDAWTVKTLLEELFADYAAHMCGRAGPIAPPDLQFADYARWQRIWCAGRAAEQQLDYWRDQLSGARPLFASADAGRISFATGRIAMEVPPDHVEALRAIAREEGATLYMALLTALQSFLSDHCGHNDIAVATPIANRSRPRTDAMVGLLENTVIIRRRVEREASFRNQIAANREAVLDAHAHQELPFEALMRRLGPSGTGDIDPAALSEIYVSVVDHNEPAPDLDGLELSRIELSQDKNSILPLNGARFMFLLKVMDDHVAGSCLFKEDLVMFEEAEAVVDGYLDHLLWLLHHPDEMLCSAPTHGRNVPDAGTVQE
ncbi:MAG: AMP-binding protein [Pseudomonadota bacterium]